jgi:hypothetical protein
MKTGLHGIAAFGDNHPSYDQFIGLNLISDHQNYLREH